jgi:hypothetical protein
MGDRGLSEREEVYRAAKKGEGTPRDAFLRPMVDIKGAQERLGFNATKVAMEIEDEFDENRWESQEALKYAGAPQAFHLMHDCQLRHFIAAAPPLLFMLPCPGQIQRELHEQSKPKILK